MPVTRSRNGPYEASLDQTNTTRFLFGDDEPNMPRRQTPDDSFPTLVRRDDQMVSLIRLVILLFTSWIPRTPAAVQLRLSFAVCQLPVLELK